MQEKPLISRLLYAARDLRSRALFSALRAHCRGQVLDIGGWDFFRTARKKGIGFEHWTTLENSPERLPESDDPRVTVLHGDGCAMQFESVSFDTVLNVQVLEHVFEPLKMVSEIERVLKPGGTAILLVPQTSTTHLAPHYYYNFSRFWILETLRRHELELVQITPLGGIWSSTASHFLFFFLQSTRHPGMSVPECKRNPLFYLLYPFMALYALAGIPICMLLSLGDLTEEPGNHLVVARKRSGSPAR